jgi:hypothetical protein
MGFTVEDTYPYDSSSDKFFEKTKDELTLLFSFLFDHSVQFMLPTVTSRFVLFKKNLIKSRCENKRFGNLWLYMTHPNENVLV